jgi:hypothetical protein
VLNSAMRVARRSPEDLAIFDAATTQRAVA